MDQHSPDMLPALEAPKTQTPQELQPVEGVPSTYHETANAQAIEQASTSAGPVLPLPPTDPTAGQPLKDASQDPAVAAIVSSMPQIADDGDLIEKEWVDKAKQIVEHTKHDPYQQNQQMTVMKTDYLKKRYNKDIKTASDK